MDLNNLLHNLKIFVRNRERQIFKLFKNTHINFCQLEEFRKKLVLEKRRAERFSYRSSILFFDFTKVISTNGLYKKLDQEEIIRLLCTNIRETDSVCLYKKNMILILLPDTDTIGSQLVCKRLLDKMNRFHSSSMKINHDDFEIEILTFPEKQSNEILLNDLVINKIENKTNAVSYFENSFDSNFRKDCFENLNLCVSTFNGSALAIPITRIYFWDQQYLSNLLLSLKLSIKRVIDIIGAILGFLLFSPVMLMTAILIKLTSSGPILFKQRRVGYRGQSFTFLKFRSMYTNSNDEIHQNYVKKLIQGKNHEINNGNAENPFFKIKRDPRITPLGRILRKTSIDELPQLINVLRGEMSLVGPRPPIEYEVKEYQNWHYRRVLDVKPGITGLWQVSGRSRTTFNEMVRLDIQYTQNWSLIMDFKILFKTVKAVVMTEGS